MSLLDLDHWSMVDGAALMGMTEDDFKQRLPCRNGDRYGENLYAQFDIWRTNYSSYGGSYGSMAGSCGQEYAPPPPYPDYWQQANTETTTGATNNYGDIAYMLQMLDSGNNGQQPTSTGGQYVVPKTEPGLSPPPYPHPTTPSTPGAAPPSAGSSVDAMEEDDGEYTLTSLGYLVVGSD